MAFLAGAPLSYRVTNASNGHTKTGRLPREGQQLSSRVRVVRDARAIHDSDSFWTARHKRMGASHYAEMARAAVTRLQAAARGHAARTQLVCCPVCFDVGLRTQSMKWPAGCGHEFCTRCHCKWLTHSSTCPICRAKIETDQFLPASRVMRRNLIGFGDENPILVRIQRAVAMNHAGLTNYRNEEEPRRQPSVPLRLVVHDNHGSGHVSLSF